MPQLNNEHKHKTKFKNKTNSDTSYENNFSYDLEKF